MHKKGFIDMVKGMLASRSSVLVVHLRVFHQPRQLTSETITISNTTRQKQKCSKNVISTFLGYLWSYEKWPKWFHWKWINEYF